MNLINPLDTAYNVPSTIILSLLGVFGSYIVWILANKMKIKFDKKIVLASVPWILLTSSIRVLRDCGILTSQIFVSPWVYGMMSFVGISTIFVLYKINKKQYWKFSLSIALLLFVISLSTLPIYKNVKVLYYLLFFLLPWIFILYTFYQKSKLSLSNLLVISSQLYDANITFVEISYFGYLEKHILSTAIMKLGGPWSFVLVKFVSITVLLYFIDKYIDDNRLSNYVKFLIILFGLLTGTRDLLRGLCMC